MTEADTCRELVTPKLVAAGWGTSESVIGEQHSFTNGRIIVAGGKVRRGKQRCADYLLYYRRDMPLAVVEAKEVGLPAETGVQQAREYAEMLGLVGYHSRVAQFSVGANTTMPWKACPTR
jgi:type I restriction enzyme, R subunit